VTVVKFLFDRDVTVVVGVSDAVGVRDGVNVDVRVEMLFRACGNVDDIVFEGVGVNVGVDVNV
jgi:hypothetical protein